MDFQKTLIALAISAVGALGAPYSKAQNLPANTAANQATETISVIGARTPTPQKLIAGSISTIDSAQINASGALNITDLLRTVPSMNISQSGPLGALTEVRFRGSESNHVLVLVDGVEINDLGQGGLVDLSHIMLSNVQTIEVLKGEQSALWGSAAIAGVISITTKTAGFSDTDTQKASLSARYGNKQTGQIQGSIKGNMDKLRYGLSLSHLDTEGQNIARSGDEKDGYQNTTGYGSLGYAMSQQNRIESQFRWVDYTSDFDSTDFETGLIADADNYSKGEQISLALNWYFTPEKSIWSQSLSYQFSQQENDNFSNGAFTGSTQGQKQRIVYNHNFALSSGQINAGVESVSEDFEQRGPISFGDPNQNQSNTSLSFIADGTHAFNHTLSVSGSIRFDNNEEFDDASSFRLGLVYQPLENVKTFASVAKAIKNPTFTERFGFFPGTFSGNPDLIPEASRSVEIGIEAELGDMDYTLSWYQSSLEDEILGFVLDLDTGVFTAMNAANDSTREGLELSISQSHDKLKWSFSYGYLDANEENNTPSQQSELRRARHTGSAWLSYDIATNQSIYLQADYTGSRLDQFFPPFPQESQIVSLDNYWLVSANYRYSFSQHLQIGVRLSNAFDADFEDVVGFVGQSRRINAELVYHW
ncbi:TonB-dependent receptor plug domain-containing protein [Ningiella sp. W23]|uniref:TonB-dependent receptor plug domain-containing protein n=1 Tax=Ningiella sp. W23 TaxID=3023715 RepID=UPI00375636E5